MPVVPTGDRIERPVRLFRVGEDDPGLRKLLVGITPDVELALGRSGWRVPCALEPRMLIGRVVDHQLDQNLDATTMRRPHESFEVAERSITRVDAFVVGDVV